MKSKMKMVEKDGKKVPAFAADGVGKMKSGGAVKKGYHRMPDGSVMKDSAHKKATGMKKGGMASDDMGRAVKRKTADVKGRAMKTRGK